MKESILNIIGEIGEAIRAIQDTFGLRLQDSDFRPEHREEILHVCIHETCHAAISQASPWIHELPEMEHTAIDEIAARILETEIARQLQLPVHSIDSHSRELSNYGLNVQVQVLGTFFNAWESMPHSPDGIDRLCRLIQTTLAESG